MNIFVYGLTETHGLPLACVLQVWGRHSVVGWLPSGHPRGLHLDPDVNLLEHEHPIPICPTIESGLHAAHDLAIVASPVVGAALNLIERAWVTVGHGETLPVVIVHPMPVGQQGIRRQHRNGMEVAYAPFNYRPHRTVGRLLTLPRIQVRHHPIWAGTDRLPLTRDRIAEAWKWVDNKIAVEALPW